MGAPSPIRLAVLAALGLLSGACSNTGSGGSGTAPLTAILVDPSEFLGPLACGTAPGDVQRYVATVIDVSPWPGVVDAGETPLPSSAPTPCHLKVIFERVTEARAYIADIQGYNRADIRPVAAGSALMVDAKTGEYVAPRWVASCGRTATPAASDAGSADAAADAASHDATVDAAGPGAPKDAARDADDPDVRRYFGCVEDRPKDGWPADPHGPVCVESSITTVLRDCTQFSEVGATPAP